MSPTPGPGPAPVMAGPDVSVVTPSAGRVDLVLRKLDALVRQTAGPRRIEFVLVDNACPDGVGDAVEARPWPFAVRVLRSDARLPAAEARRWASAEASGRWVWWSDDDVVPDDEALERHLAVHEQHDCVTIGSIRFVDGDRVTRWRPRGAGPVHVTGVNTMLPRAALNRVENDVMALPRPYGGEDTVIGLALAEVGLPIIDVQGAWVAHHGPPPSAAGDPERGFDAGYNAAVIAARYPRSSWALGVHPWQLAAKRRLLAPFAHAKAPRLRFERAYLDGALAGRRHAGDPPARPPEAPA